jgi:hypothetical protein
VDGWLAALPLEGVGVVGLCVAFVLAMWRGWIMPASVVRELTRMRDERIAELVAERVELRATRDVLAEALKEQSGQVNELLELATTGNALMKALASATGREPV